LNVDTFWHLLQSGVSSPFEGEGIMAGLIVPLLAVSALGAPVLGQDISDVDVPVVTGPGTGVYEVFIAPDGWVEDCRTLRSDYSAENNSRVCDALLQFKAQRAAQGPDGKPIHAAAVVARQRGGSEAPWPADVEVEVATLPRGANGRKSVGLAVLVDQYGQMKECQASDGSADAYARVACEQAGGLRFAVRKNRHGLAVPYLQQVKVDFVAGNPGS
jgi:hypothetical protein